MGPPDSAFFAPLGLRERSLSPWLAWVGLTLLLSVGGTLVLSTVLTLLDAAPVVEGIGRPLPEGPRRLIGEAAQMFVLSASLAMLAIAVLLAARISFGRPAWTFVTPARPFRGRLLLAGFVVFAVLVFGGLLVERALVGEVLEPPVLDPNYAADARLVYLTAGALFLLLAAAAEEIVFRGLFLQLTGAFTRKTAALVIVNGLVFSALHLDPSPTAFAARAVSGGVWAWTVLRLGGIEFALGAHFANNLLLTALTVPFSEGAQVGRDLPWQYLAGDVVVTVGAAAAVGGALRSPRARRWLAGPEGL